MSKHKRILMAVGSSGGHIYPAIAIAEKLESLSGAGDSYSIHFVHSGSALGQSLFSNLKYPVYEISLGGLARGQSFFQKIKTIFQLPKALLKSFLLIRKTKAQLILGTGGSVTGPVLLAGFLMGRKTAIWEGNAVMGLANRILSFFVSRIFTVFPSAIKSFQRKQTLCAYPLRKKISSFQNQRSDSAQLQENERTVPSYKREMESQKDFFKVLILGGSQGSVFLNQIVSQALEEEDWRKGIFIYHQTGEKSFENLKQKYQSVQNVEAFAFSRNIEEYYQKCDLLFSRAGSGAIWEAASFGKALVLIPLTHSAGGHQLQNALKLSSKNCVELIQEKDFNVQTFKEKLVDLQQNFKRREQLAQNLKAGFQGDGAGQIAEWILSL